MPGFKYQAYSVEGKLHKGVLEADSARQARSLLRDQGLTPYRVDVIAANDAAGGPRGRPGSLSSPQGAQPTPGPAPPLPAGGTPGEGFKTLLSQAQSPRGGPGVAAPRRA